MSAERGVGRAVFAAVYLMIAGVLNIIYGIAAIGHSAFFQSNTHYFFASLKSWGWISLILGILEILAALSLIRGDTFGRWFAIFVASLAAIGRCSRSPPTRSGQSPSSRSACGSSTDSWATATRPPSALGASSDDPCCSQSTAPDAALAARADDTRLPPGAARDPAG